MQHTGYKSIGGYLKKEYTHEMESSELFPRFGTVCRGTSGTHIQVCVCWAGVTGCVPGTAAGSQAVESFHRPWEQDMIAMGIASNIEVVLHKMQELYVKWSRDERMDLPAAMSFLPGQYSSANMSTQALQVLKRWPAELFFVHRHLPNLMERNSVEWGPLRSVSMDPMVGIESQVVDNLQLVLELTHDQLEAHLCSIGVVNASFAALLLLVLL